MHLSHTLLTVCAAALLWASSGLVAPPPPSAAVDVPALGIPRSAYGSLIARAMRGSLYAYWHGGEAYSAPPPASSPQANLPATPPPPPPMPGVFSRRRLGATPPAAAPEAASPSAPIAEAAPEPAPSGPLIFRAASWLNGLETRRTRRQERLARSPAHQRFINASVGWRLRFAYNLDPGDHVIYEILHHHILTTSQNQTKALEAARALSAQALLHTQSDQAGMVDALTGVGAAVNMMNDLIMSAQPGSPSREDIARIWGSIVRCQRNYREIRASAEREGWWQNIPEKRRMEIDDHARFLDRLTAKMHDQLVAGGLLVG